jgi:glyoxylase-like metal-dependent hydrolase (beta-lactamase superfamily II)
MGRGLFRRRDRRIRRVKYDDAVDQPPDREEIRDKDNSYRRRYCAADCGAGDHVPAALEIIPALTPELLAENRHWMEPTALDSNGWLILCFQSYVLRTPNKVILVDSCIGNHKPRPKPPEMEQQGRCRLHDWARCCGLRVEDIDIVMCTHLHADHVGWNTRLENGRWVPTFPNARYVFTATE